MLHLELKVLLHGRTLDEAVPVPRPLPQLNDDGRVADEDGHEWQNKLSDRREETVGDPEMDFQCHISEIDVYTHAGRPKSLKIHNIDSGLPDVFFKPNRPILEALELNILYLLCPFVILCGHLLCFIAVCYALWLFVTFSTFWYIVSRKIWQPCIGPA
jgi:hypothetical protein